MQAVTATEFARNFSQMLDQVEHHGVTLSIVRNHKQIATVSPRLKPQTAMELLGDIYRPLDGPVDDNWMADIRRMDEVIAPGLLENLRDPWAQP
jgi:antitoxin (DNA-binding transcriptional repressor) of toxin-antitoxin stability system